MSKTTTNVLIFAGGTLVGFGIGWTIFELRRASE